MNVTFMIGNGFDLSCGMKSRYTDVCKKYIKEKKSDTKVISLFKHDIKSDLKTWGDFEIAMAKYAEKASDEEAYIDCISNFREFMRKYLISEQKKVSSKLYEYDCLKGSLFEIANSIYERYYTVLLPSEKKAIQIQYEKSSSITYNAISYNYTRIFDLLWSYAFQNGYISSSWINRNEVIHIHGTLGDTGKKNDMTLGVDNINQFPLTSTISKKIQLAFVKPFFNKQFQPDRLEETKKVIENSTVICLYGMSLGESDLSWKKMLVEWLELSKEHYFIYFDHETSQKKGLHVTEEASIETETKKIICAKLGVSDSSDVIKRIFIPVGNDIFNIEQELKKKKSVKPDNDIFRFAGPQ